MSNQNISDYLNELDVCKICILRYLNGRCNEYLDVDKSFQERNIQFNEPNKNEDPQAMEIDTNDSVATNGCSKRKKSNICIACLGLFQNDTIDDIVKQIITTTDLHTYDCETIYTSVSLPILMQIRELSLWIALIKKFSGEVSDSQIPNISIKEVFKYLVNDKLCKQTSRKLEHDQNGILVNVFFEHDCEDEEIKRLDLIKPDYLKEPEQKGKKRGNHKPPPMTRNYFEKHFFPKNLNLDECLKNLPAPPNVVSQPIKLVKCSITGPTIFVAGRYRKLSRALSQTPWVLQGRRKMEDSIQEIIARNIAPYFEVDPIAQESKINFMASGREDCDVRCLGKGRPFVLEINDSRKSTLPVNVAAEMQNKIELSEKVSVQHLQLVKREELVHIKTGEEKKKKSYRALCILNEPATVDLLRKLDMPEGFLMQQKTPLRVLHRRPYLTRPRQVYSMKGYLHKDNPKVIILDVITQAGAYVKEMVHGEFGRTNPSVCSIIGQDIDIVALDVVDIDLDWPKEVDNICIPITEN